MSMDGELLGLLNQAGDDVDYLVVAGTVQDRNVGDFITIVRSGDHFHLFVSDPPPTLDYLQAL